MFFFYIQRALKKFWKVHHTSLGWHVVVCCRQFENVTSWTHTKHVPGPTSAKQSNNSILLYLIFIAFKNLSFLSSKNNVERKWVEKMNCIYFIKTKKQNECFALAIYNSVEWCAKFAILKTKKMLVNINFVKIKKVQDNTFHRFS